MYQLTKLDNRIGSITFLMICALFVIAARLFYLQISWADHYINRGQKNFLRTESIPSRRGNILDCNGTILATNRPVTQLVWQATGNHTLSVEQQELLSHLSNITQSSLISLQAITHAERYYKPCMMAKDLTHKQLSKITERYPNHPNVSITTNFERFYPYGSYASHVVGYLSRHIDSTSQGQMGLEKIYNNILKGQEGTIVKTINSTGRNITQLTQHDSLAGNNIHTTLDINLQSIAERIYPEQFTGCLLIMDPENGAIRALVSRPTFNPSLFLKPISHENWSELQHKKPFLNRVLNPYPPGSIFKLITISAALEQGLMHENHIWDCKGFVEFTGRKYWCNRRWGHGEITTTQAMAHSCNVLFYELGKKIDIDLLAEYAKRFGLGEPTGFLFPEGQGIIPSREWKKNIKGERWWPGETLSVSIGQSFLLSTPLQVARMISSIFTGYLVKPRIISDESIEKEPLVLQPSTIDFLKRSMHFVVTSGTGKQVNTVKDIEIYAKTSTAQITDFSKRKLSTDFLEHAWFVAYFQYKEYKPLVFLILVENAGSSQVASQIAKQLLVAFKNYHST